MNSAMLVDPLLYVALPWTVRLLFFFFCGKSLSVNNVWYCNHWAKENMTDVPRQFLLLCFFHFEALWTEDMICSCSYFCCKLLLDLKPAVRRKCSDICSNGPANAQVQKDCSNLTDKSLKQVTWHGNNMDGGECWRPIHKTTQRECCGFEKSCVHMETQG